MNKNLTVKMGNCNHRKYIPHLLDLIAAGAIDPVKLISKTEPMHNAIEAYEAFDARRPGWLKVELKPVSA
jgi:threonine dehydrogenase-like Zn-dependent dehydrogenase